MLLMFLAVKVRTANQHARHHASQYTCMFCESKWKSPPRDLPSSGPSLRMLHPKACSGPAPGPERSLRLTGALETNLSPPHPITETTQRTEEPGTQHATNQLKGLETL